MSHPFGELLREYRMRRDGLTQTRLAHLIGYDHALLTRMSQGKKDLTGPSGRYRVVSIIEALLGEGVRLSVAEANKLLKAADQPPLYDGLPVEHMLLQKLDQGTSLTDVHSTRTHLPNLNYYSPPAPLHPLIGRDREITDLLGLFRHARMVTLTGAGGSGKTRVAIELAQRIMDLYPQGVCFVSLAPLMHPEDVLGACIQALQVNEDPALSAVENLKYFLCGRRLLLLLDNFEHVIDAALILPELLMSAPGLAVLATSREPLCVSGEYAYPLDPLPVLPVDANHGLHAVQQTASAQLFIERVRSVVPSFKLTVTNAADVAELCRRLDGLPLALELAAARMRHLTLHQLLDERGLHGFEGGLRDLPARHRTLRATIEWSYRLLTPDEQRWLRILGLFHNGAEITQLSIAGALYTPDHRAMDKDSLAACLHSLTDKSLVRASKLQDGATRYSLLELIREYAIEQLHLRGEYDDGLRRHAEAYAQLAAQSVPYIRGQDLVGWVTRIERDIPNLRAALEWCFGQHGDMLVGCRIVGRLWHFWCAATKYVRDAEKWLPLASGSLTENMPIKVRAWVACAVIAVDLPSMPALIGQDTRELCQRSLRLCEEAHDEEGIILSLIFTGYELCRRPSDRERGIRIIEESIERARQAGIAWVLGYAHRFYAIVVIIQNNFKTAEHHFLESIAALEGCGDYVNVGVSLWMTSQMCRRLGRFDEALSFAERGIEMSMRSVNLLDTGLSYYHAGEAHRVKGNWNAAVASHERYLLLMDEYFSEFYAIMPRLGLCRALLDAGEPTRAGVLLAEAIALLQRRRIEEDWVVALEDAAILACTRGEWVLAAQFFGSFDAYVASFDFQPTEFDLADVARYRTGVIVHLQKEIHEAASERGRAMPVKAAFTNAASWLNTFQK